MISWCQLFVKSTARFENNLENPGGGCDKLKGLLAVPVFMGRVVANTRNTPQKL